MFRGTFLCFSLFPWPLILSLGTNEKILAPASYTLPSGVYVHCWDSPEFSLLHAGHSQLSQSLSIQEMLQSLSHPGPLPDCVRYVSVCFGLGSPALDPTFQTVSELSSFLCGYPCGVNWGYCCFLLMGIHSHGFHFYLSTKISALLVLISQLLAHEFSRVSKVWF